MLGWRVVQNGAMIESSLGNDPKGNERTSTFIAREGQLIKGDLSKSMVERYDNNDEFVRSIVERVEITTDDDGNDVATPTGKVAETSTEVDADVIKRAENAEKEATELRSRVSELEQNSEQVRSAALAAQETDQARIAELEAQVSTLESAVSDAETAAEGALSYNALSPAALKAEAEAKDVTVTRADGKEGDPLKADYVKALEEARQPS